MAFKCFKSVLSAPVKQLGAVFAFNLITNPTSTMCHAYWSVIWPPQMQALHLLVLNAVCLNIYCMLINMHMYNIM